MSAPAELPAKVAVPLLGLGIFGGPTFAPARRREDEPPALAVDERQLVAVAAPLGRRVPRCFGPRSYAVPVLGPIPVPDDHLGKQRGAGRRVVEVIDLDYAALANHVERTWRVRNR